MPLNTLLKKRKVQTLSGRAARLASRLFILTVWTKVTDLSVLIATTWKRKTKVSSYHSVETNKSIKSIMYQKCQEIWLVVYSRSNLIGVTYIHLSLIHWSTEPWGAIHSNKISGLRFENFLVWNGSRQVRTVSVHSTRKTSFTLI